MSKYTIIGSGISGLMAAKAIAQKDYGQQITIITPNTSKTVSKPGIAYYLQNNAQLQQLQRLPDDFYVQNNFKFIYANVNRIDTKHNRLKLSNDSTHEYTKLIIATGYTPQKPEDCQRQQVLTANNTQDAQKIQRYIPHTNKAVVIGATPSGLLTAYALAKRGIAVTVIEQSNYILDQSIPQQLHKLLLAEHRKHNITFLLSDNIKHYGGIDQNLTYVVTNKNTRLEAQLAILCNHGKPDISYLERSGIKKRNGILVNNKLQTNVNNIYAAGAVAEFEDKQHNQNYQYYQWDLAHQMGEIAGNNAAGAKKSFSIQVPMISTMVAGLPLVQVGQTQTEGRRQKVIEHINNLQSTYTQIIHEDNVIVGFLSYGYHVDTYALQRIIHRQVPIKEEDLNASVFDWKPYVWK